MRRQRGEMRAQMWRGILSQDREGCAEGGSKITPSNLPIKGVGRGDYKAPAP
jgi:hypothetical protein